MAGLVPILISDGDDSIGARNRHQTTRTDDRRVSGDVSCGLVCGQLDAIFSLPAHPGRCAVSIVERSWQRRSSPGI